MSKKTASNDFVVIINGAHIPSSDVSDLTVALDDDQAPMAKITLGNDQQGYLRRFNMGDTVEIKVVGSARAPRTDADKEIIFTAHIAGIEPRDKPGGGSDLVLRAFDRHIHRARARKQLYLQPKFYWSKKFELPPAEGGWQKGGWQKGDWQKGG